MCTSDMIIEIFDNFLQSKGIFIPSSIKEMEESGETFETNPVVIFGTDYYELRDAIEEIL